MWNSAPMTEPFPTLYDDVQARLATARQRVSELKVSDDVKTAALRRLTRLERASTYDLSVVSREVSAFLAELDAGEVPIYE